MPMMGVRGADLHYRLDGPLAAPMLMLANSLGTTLEMWEPQMPALTTAYRVLRYDMRGHGASSTPAAPFSIDALAEDALALLDGLAIARTHFCGLSVGGMVGLWLGAHAPGRLDKLVLCNTAATFGVRTVWDARIESVVRDGMAAVAPTVLERWFTPEFHHRDPAAVARVRTMLLAMKPEGYIPACAAVRDLNQRAEVADIQAPTLVIAGNRDRATPPSESRWLANHIAGARFVELPAAHLSNIEATSLFNQSVLDFLAA